MKDIFQEVKIKMVMKLKKISRAAAITEITRLDRLRLENASARKKSCGTEEERLDEALLRVAPPRQRISAQEFFEEM